jgi:hypothetical protein
MTETGPEESELGLDASGRTGPPVGREGQEPAHDAPVPPYEGRTTQAAQPGEPEERQQRFAGVHPGGRTESLTDPDQTPGARTASPADEQPASQQIQSRPSDPGVGPAHYPGTPRGEDEAEQAEPGREDVGPQGESGRPAGESTGRAATTVRPESADS